MNDTPNSDQYEYQASYSTLRDRRRKKNRRSSHARKAGSRRQSYPLLLFFCIILAVGLLISFFAIDWSTVWANHVFYMPGSSVSLATPNPQGTPTATPFMPDTPTVAAVAQVNADTIQNGESDLTAASNQQKIVKQSGQVYVLLLGSDQREGDNGFRTDEIMLLCINRLTFQVSIVSFPRDLYLDIPGYEADRINTAMGKGGFELLSDTFEINFGFRPDYYAMTNFWSFVETVDNLGGLEINVPEYLEDKCEPPKTGTCFVNAGDTVLDGETALWYVRSRRTTSDFARTERGRQVLKALFVKLMSLDAVTRFPDLYETYQEYVETNMHIDEMLTLLPVATVLVKDTDRIHFYSIGPEETDDYFTPAGAQVLLPDFNAIHNMLVDALSK